MQAISSAGGANERAIHLAVPPGHEQSASNDESRVLGNWVAAIVTVWDKSFDFVIVGSGGGSMCASLMCKSLGKRALIVEKINKVGGSTGYSGGVWWLPNNPVMKRHGVDDSLERART